MAARLAKASKPAMKDRKSNQPLWSASSVGTKASRLNPANTGSVLKNATMRVTTLQEGHQQPHCGQPNDE